MSLPGGHRLPDPLLRRRARDGALRGRARGRRRSARDRYLAEDALELIDIEYEPLDPVLDAEVAADTSACVSDRSFHYGDMDGCYPARTS